MFLKTVNLANSNCGYLLDVRKLLLNKTALIQMEKYGIILFLYSSLETDPNKRNNLE